MKKWILSIPLMLLSVFSFADEGMWLMTFIDRLKYTDWQKEGLQLTPEEIYSVNQASLKDAIVSFGGYCTGELISDQGLILTNHHCGYGVIAELSTEENDYLKNGFWAKDKSQELKPEDLYVRFLVKMGDATDRINKRIETYMTEDERSAVINEEIEKIQKENDENGKYTVSVKSFYGGNEFYYFIYQDYNDVRFVGAPPSSIGKYGGDTDNWEWPRHTGDFSMFRVYGDKDGNPADYSMDNVPLKPKHHLPIQMTGVQPGDFAMTIGYPGRTERYMPSYGIAQAINVEYPTWITAANTTMRAMKKNMDASDKVRLDYAGNYSSTANYWKNRIGMIEALNKLNTIEKKRQYEEDFKAWYSSDEGLQKKYGDVLSTFDKYFSSTNDYVLNRTFLVRGFLSGSALALKPYIINRMLSTYNQQDKDNKEMMLPKIEEEIKSQYATFNLQTEADILASLLTEYVNTVPEKSQVEYIKKINKTYNGDFAEYVTKAINSSSFTSADEVIKMIKTADEKALENDELLRLSNAILASYRAKGENFDAMEDEYNKAYRLFIDGLRKTYPDRIFFPDANSTMRLSTGKVVTLPDNPKKPNDAKENYYTTFKGMIDKYQPGDEEFDLPKVLLELYKTKDYGMYANKHGELPINFLTDNDITGGNSGSPVIGGNGALIGLAFDGNWEAMSGDIEFEQELQRTICVDARYLLFVIDKFAGAKHLVDEMTLIK